MQLVLIPLLIVHFGFTRGVLAYLPSSKAINAGLFVQIVAFLSYILGFVWKARNIEIKSSSGSVRKARPFTRPGFCATIAILFLVIGLVGFALRFASFRHYLDYLADPTSKVIRVEYLVGSLQGALSTFMTPFLGYAFVFGWTWWVDTKSSPKSLVTSGVVTVFVLCIISFLNLAYSFNRGAIVGPVAGIISVFSLRVRRIPNTVLVASGVTLLYAALLLGEYRTTKSSEAAGEIKTLGRNISFVDWFQVYGSGPQFSGFLIENLDYGVDPKWGITILSSVLSPVPVLGKGFRSTSGVELYNRLIYDWAPSSDQVIPFAAEVFINFHVIGVIIAFILVGVVIANLQSSYLDSGSGFESYYFFIMSVWVSFLVVGSIAVLSQIFVYFFWPVYLYMILRAFLPKHTIGLGR
jgi:hypothetical protein